MKTIELICSKYLADQEEEEKDSVEFTERSNQCISLFEKLSETLNEEQKKTLAALDMEYFLLGGQRGEDDHKKGAEKGFKFAMRLMIDSMRD